MLLMFFCVVSEIKIHNKMYSFLDFNVHLWWPIYGGLFMVAYVMASK